MADTIFHLYPLANQDNDIDCLRRSLGMSAGGRIDISKLPFTPEDATAGTENELQTAITGKVDNVDLPLTIKQSSFYANLLKRINCGDMPAKRLAALEHYLEPAGEQVWENSWVRFPLEHLSSYSRKIFERDLLYDKSQVAGPRRSDSNRFTFHQDGRTWLRVPISYLLKLSLAEVISDGDLPTELVEAGQGCMKHFLNDNTSPETFSFYPSRATDGRTLGSNAAAEMSKRFAYTQMLLQYANLTFQLGVYGQKALVYFASNPPLRQNELNDLIPDNFYRELFMSPCLSGWNRGEEKYRYMVTCHQVLSRSQLNAMKKLKDAGIITTNLVVLPNTSNISLANNGTHLSLGSTVLSSLLQSQHPDFTPDREKWAGDLAIKIIEHFLPLFVGTYSAAPYRLAFSDFHPEKALGFLPHELDFTHLRMIWRRWKKKARLNCCGHSLTPFGPEWLDRLISKTMGLKGDYIPDKRLIDYLVSLMSTDQSPALDGCPGNHDKLLQDLESQGTFDASMSLYLLYKLRSHGDMGFSGFEGRYYSLFFDLQNDFGEAVNLQMLISALAYKYILEGTITHRDIPDNPSIESERRQIFFATAIGLPTFFIRRDTGNLFMRKILQRVKKIRPSARYQGYFRLYNLEYRRALLSLLREDAGDLIEMMGLAETLQKLEDRLLCPQFNSAEGRLIGDILQDTGVRHPLQMEARSFNQAAESYYRHRLRRKHYDQALTGLAADMAELDKSAMTDGKLRSILHALLPENTSAGSFFQRHQKSLLEGAVDGKNLQILLQLTTLSISRDQDRFRHRTTGSVSREIFHASPVR